MRNLEYIDEVDKNASSLKDFKFRSCKKIKNFEFLRCLKELEWLAITDCGEIQSLRFIKQIPKLQNISFVDTNIIDGDLSPCIGLNYVGFNDKKHYSHKFMDFEKTNKIGYKSFTNIKACIKLDSFWRSESFSN